MKKNRKRIIGLLMAAVILTTEVPVYAGSIHNTADVNAATVEDMENAGSQDAKDAGSTDAAGTEKPSDAEHSNNAANQENADDAANQGKPADVPETEKAQTEEKPATETETKNPNVEGTVEQNTEASQDTQTSDSESKNNPVQGEVITDENNDDVEIKEDDRPYLALGADLSDAQRATVLALMGIDAANLDQYDVSYVTNAEEHQYLDAYIDPSQIGSKSWSSVVIVEREKGNGLNISTNNISYCTVGMYKNALTTAGVTDADIIVAGPQKISGTAALVGIFKAYQEMTGKKIEDTVVDAALNELVITGELADSIAGLTNEEVEEFIAYIKSVIAENNLSDETSINKAIDDACEKYGVTLTDEERQMIVDLLLKITSLGIDLSGLVDYAASLYNSFKNGGGDGVFASIGKFFADVFSTIGDFFKNLFS